MTTQTDGIHAKATGAFNSTFSSDEVAVYYNQWASHYDDELNDQSVCRAPDNVADMINDVYRENKSTVRILDVAAGTGIVGEKLYIHGFRNIDGLDPSEGMLNVCKSKNLYKELICDFMTSDMPNIKTDAYDCVVSSGGMGNGHVPRDALKEMVRVVKPGGHVCIAMREEFLTLTEEYNENKLEGLMSNLEHTGKWRKLERKRISDYLRDAVGILYLYKVL